MPCMAYMLGAMLHWTSLLDAVAANCCRKLLLLPFLAFIQVCLEDKQCPTGQYCDTSDTTHVCRTVRNSTTPLQSHAITVRVAEQKLLLYADSGQLKCSTALADCLFDTCRAVMDALWRTARSASQTSVCQR